jgi:hypothetical protein
MVALAKQGGRPGISPGQAARDVARARDKRAELGRQIAARTAGGRVGGISARERDILTTVKDSREVSTRGIQDRMARPFQNAKSVHLAVEQLRVRGLLARRKLGNANMWSLSAEGQRALAEVNGDPND